MTQILEWLEAVFILLVVRTGLACLRYSLLIKVLQRSSTLLRSAPTKPGDPKGRVLAAMRRARYFGIGKYSCLEEALAIHWMLRRRNVEAQVQIGVRRTEENQLLGHAWVECAGEIVSIDLHSPASYVVLTPHQTEHPTEDPAQHPTQHPTE